MVDQTNEIINTYSINPDAPVSAEGGSNGSTDGGTTASGELPDQIFALGEPIPVGDLIMTVLEVTESEGNDFFKPDAGNTFLLVNLSFENTGSEQAVVSTLLQMSLIDGDGNSYDIDIVAMTLGEQTADGEIEPGATLTGVAGFQIPADASGLVFVYEELFGDRVGVALE